MDSEALLDPLERALRWVQSAASGRPYNFSWFRDGLLAASGIPATRRSAEWLAERGVESVLTLTEWIPGPLLEVGFTIKHVPMRNGMPASPRKLEEAVGFLIEQLGAGRRSLVHCLSGRGRTGMVLAAYLVEAEGYSAVDAIREVSSLRPGSLRNRRQALSVVEFELSLAGRRSMRRSTLRRHHGMDPARTRTMGEEGHGRERSATTRAGRRWISSPLPPGDPSCRAPS